ncbi:MAG: hypothetical protein ACQKBW_00940, partial [Puniceicoccales bacterium]
MDKKTLLLSLSTIALSALCQAQWTDLVSDDFNSYSFGDQPGGNWYNTNGPSNTGGNDNVTNEEGGTNPYGVTLPASVFGSGNALYFYDLSNTQIARAGINFGDNSQSYDIVRASFDFSFAQLTSGTSNFGTICFTSADTDAFSGGTTHSVHISLFNDGKLGWTGGNLSVSDPTGAHTMDIVANGTDS